MSSLQKMYFKNRVFVDLFRLSNSLEEKDIVDICFERIKSSKIKITPQNKPVITNLFKTLFKTYRIYWKTCSASWKTFSYKKKDWLDTNVNYEFEKLKEKRDIPKYTRHFLPYHNKCQRAKHLEVSKVAIAARFNVEVLLKAAAKAGKKDEKYEMASDILGILNPKVINDLALTPDEALSLFIDVDLSKRGYINLRSKLKQHIKSSKAVLPSYYQLKKAKESCYPSGIVVDDWSASVNLQNLADHTTKRLFKSIESSLKPYVNCEEEKIVHKFQLLFKMGVDGSSGQSQFNQQLSSTMSDCNIIASTVTPMQLKCEDVIIWENEIPSSIRFCRPLSFEYQKESKAYIQNFKSDIDAQIANIEPTVVVLFNDVAVEVRHNFVHSVVDGKVVAYFTETASMQRCNVCKAKPTQLNSIENITNGTFDPDPACLVFGVQLLHLWIRIFEFLLHLSYKINIKKWRVSTQGDKLEVKRRKKIIQQRFEEQLNLRVDQPISGGAGNSNCGNTSRRAFKNSKLLSEILELDFEFVKRFHTILVTLSCMQTIDVSKFRVFCLDTMKIHIELYSWYLIPSSVHRVLIHGAEIIAVSPLSVGKLTEENGEHRNKLIKSDRIAHARHTSRENNLRDIFSRALETSDPLITKLTQDGRKKKVHRDLPDDVKSLLVNGLPEHTPQSIETINEVFDTLDNFVINSELED